MLRGKTGSVRVAGVGLVAPSPARFDLTLTFGNFTAPSKGRHAGAPLGLRGAVQFDFIMPRSGKTALPMGLFRGFLTLSGRFGGTAEVYGEVDEGKVVALVVTANKKVLRVGRVPRELVATSRPSPLGQGRARRTGRDARLSSIHPRASQSLPTAECSSPIARTTRSARSPRPGGSRLSCRKLDEPTDVGLDGSGTLIAIANNHDKPLVRVDTTSGALTRSSGPSGTT